MAGTITAALMMQRSCLQHTGFGKVRAPLRRQSSQASGQSTRRENQPQLASSSLQQRRRGGGTESKPVASQLNVAMHMQVAPVVRSKRNADQMDVVSVVQTEV